MVGWIFPIAFWLVGLIIAASPGVLFRTLEHQKEKLRIDADQSKQDTHQTATLRTVEEKIFSIVPWWWFTLFTSIICAIFITFGFVALSFVITW